MWRFTTNHGVMIALTRSQFGNFEFQKILQWLSLLLFRCACSFVWTLCTRALLMLHSRTSQLACSYAEDTVDQAEFLVPANESARDACRLLPAGPSTKSVSFREFLALTDMQTVIPEYLERNQHHGESRGTGKPRHGKRHQEGYYDGAE